MKNSVLFFSKMGADHITIMSCFLEAEVTLEV